MSSNSSSDWNVRLMPALARRLTRQPPISWPSTVMLPSLVGTKPVMASIAVVFPAPLGPIRPSTCPGLTLRLS